MSLTLFGKDILSLPQQVQQNTENIKYLLSLINIIPFTWKNNYNNTINYNISDIVQINEKIYIALQPNINILPGTNNLIWLHVFNTY